MRKQPVLLALIFVIIVSCKKNHEPVTAQPQPVPAAPYFPPAGGTVWETASPSSLGWNETELANLFTYLQQKDTKAFIILKNGRVVTEKYFGTFTADSIWYLASAGKTMTAFLTGLAQQQGLVNISNKTSTYLGAGWTSLPAAKEDLITVKHQLTMTTGLDDDLPAGTDCTLPACLQYKGDAGTRWAYHNAPYTLLEKVVEAATGMTYNNYFQQAVSDKIGMTGRWVKTGYNNVFYTTARSMARFGLLLENKGKWEQATILNEAYFATQVNSSQTLNPAYGYLTWLNGKNNYMLPSLQVKFNGFLIPNAPSDMFAALGKNDQKIYVVPSQDLVVVRLGESAGNVQSAVSGFDNELWGKLKTIIK